MYFIVEYEIDDDEATVYCYNADLEGMLQAVANAKKAGFRIMSHKDLNHQCDMRINARDYNGVIVVK